MKQIFLKDVINRDDVFIIEYDEKNKHTFFDFKVYEVPPWNVKDIEEKTEYLNGVIHGDGTAHFYFGEQGEGYVFLSGKLCFANHVKLIKYL